MTGSKTFAVGDQVVFTHDDGSKSERVVGKVTAVLDDECAVRSVWNRDYLVSNCLLIKLVRHPAKKPEPIVVRPK